MRFVCRHWVFLGALFLLGALNVNAAMPEGLLKMDGTWKQGSILRGKVAPGYKLKFHNRTVPLTPSGDFVIGLGRDFGKKAELVLIGSEGQARRYSFDVARRSYDIQKVTGVPERTVNPDPKFLDRINREAALAAKAREQTIQRLDFLESFQWPLKGPITGVYGSQRYYNGEPRTPHFGVDVAAPTGTRVAAPAGGVVTLVHPDMFFSGGTLIVDHGYGLSSTFMHLSKILVKEGQEIQQGQMIAEVGATGRVTGAHLDWRMNWFDQRVDPTVLVPPMQR